VHVWLAPGSVRVCSAYRPHRPWDAGHPTHPNSDLQGVDAGGRCESVSSPLMRSFPRQMYQSRRGTRTVTKSHAAFAKGDGATSPSARCVPVVRSRMIAECSTSNPENNFVFSLFFDAHCFYFPHCLVARVPWWSPPRRRRLGRGFGHRYTQGAPRVSRLRPRGGVCALSRNESQGVRLQINQVGA